MILRYMPAFYFSVLVNDLVMGTQVSVSTLLMNVRDGVIVAAFVSAIVFGTILLTMIPFWLITRLGVISLRE